MFTIVSNGIEGQLTVAIALKPATPAPMTRTLQGGIYIAVRRGKNQVIDLLTLL